MNLARRQFLRARKGPVELRPPWLLDAASFTEGCTRCGACIESCPEHIIEAGDAGFPRIDFNRGECSFCGECTSDCEAHLFIPRSEQQLPAWRYRARVNAEDCLTTQGVHCRSCEDYCEPRAIRFPPRAGGTPQPLLDTESCTGCGACVAPCPTRAIAMGEC